MPIFDLLVRNAKSCPDDVALVEINPAFEDKHKTFWSEYQLVETNPNERYRKELTWKEFNDKSNRIANLLLSRGVHRGEKIAILLMNCIEWLPIYFGILKAGAIAVPMNYRYTADEIRYCLKLADVTKVVFGVEFIGRIESIYSKLSKIDTFFFVGDDCPSFADPIEKVLYYASHREPELDIKEEDDAVIYFSSGTTGFPKAILHAHRSLSSSAECEQAHHGQTKDDCFLCIPPLYHTGAKMHWFGSLYSCSKAVLLRGTEPEWIMKAISQEHVTIVWLLVPWAQDILDAIDRGDINLAEYDLDQLRLMHIGAQPVPPSLIKRWMAYFPHHQYDTNYGLSESIGPGCVHLGVENINKVGAIGIPGHNWEAKIIDENGEEVPQGSVGELAVKGPGVMKCYYKDKEATEQVLRDGWLWTGDMAMKDEDGFIYLVDRKKDVIISGGENLYPVQIEDFLRKNDNIKDVAVIGLPHPRLGEIAAAIIELKPDHPCTKEDIEEFCLDLPRYKRPREIIFDKVPRNPTGKIEKPKLREKYHSLNLIADQTKG